MSVNAHFLRACDLLMRSQDLLHQLAGLLRAWLPRFVFNTGTLSKILAASTLKKHELISSTIIATAAEILSDGLRGRENVPLPTLAALLDVRPFSSLLAWVLTMISRLSSSTAKLRSPSRSPRCEIRPRPAVGVGSLRRSLLRRAPMPLRSSVRRSTLPARDSRRSFSTRCGKPEISSCLRFAWILDACTHGRYESSSKAQLARSLVAAGRRPRDVASPVQPRPSVGTHQSHSPISPPPCHYNSYRHLALAAILPTQCVEAGAPSRRSRRGRQPGVCERSTRRAAEHDRRGQGRPRGVLEHRLAVAAQTLDCERDGRGAVGSSSRGVPLDTL